MANMEKKRFLFLRRLPKKSVLLLYVLCTMVAACALITLYLDRDETLVHNIQQKNNNSLDRTHTSTTATRLYIPPGRSWSSLKDAERSSLKDSTAERSSLKDRTAERSSSKDSNVKPVILLSPLKLIDVADRSSSKDTNVEPGILMKNGNVESSTTKSTSNSINTLMTRHPTTQKSSRPKNRKKTFLDNTKYIYLTTTNTTTKTPTTTTKTPRDTCDSGNERDTKLILLWTSFFGHWEYMPKERFGKCARCRNCRVTRDRSRLPEADAVVFHARDMSLADLPTLRLPHQRWVFYCLESPPYSDFPGLQHMRHMFNWTMTYRLDSDVVSQYGTVKRIRPPRPLDMSALRNSFYSKRGSVAWLSSHCPTEGGRDAFVTELKRHIDVDVYGTCGTLDCPKESKDHCHKQFANNYKFILAFENTVCKDYITEKFYRALQFNIVPVVFGGAIYERQAPPGSFVDALKFKSPRHLAFFLRGVGEDFERYKSYFEWKRDYSVVLVNEKECGMCELLHRGDKKSSFSSYGDLRKWWVDGSQCRTWEPKL